ncbi:MAG: alpha/beta fold hydrolase [Bacteroidetes bacterium]|nr:alpha/beta fold hydrolase [Bacteroidota bacterium]
MSQIQLTDARAWVLLATALMCFSSATSQVDQITAALTDTSRAGRIIGLDIRVPSDAIEALPWVVFGHGFVMPTTDYDDLATALAAEGFVVVLVDTETSFAPSHEDFGLDLAYVVERAATDLSELDGVLGDRVALMGHSMGGGAAWLAAAQLGSAVDALIGLAPAETSPSAIAAGSEIVAPTMVISGSGDLVTLPSDHHEPMYAATSNADCRAWVNLIGGGHCGFADAGTLCDFGEITFTGMPRQEQQAHSFMCVQLWLEAHLQDAELALGSVEAYAESQAEVEVDWTCETAGVPGASGVPHVAVGPNPATNVLRIRPLPDACQLHASDMLGREWPVVWSGQETLDVSMWPRGAVVLRVQSPSGQTVSRSVVLIH